MQIAIFWFHNETKQTPFPDSGFIYTAELWEKHVLALPDPGFLFTDLINGLRYILPVCKNVQISFVQKLSKLPVKQARKSSGDAQAGYAQFKKNRAG